MWIRRWIEGRRLDREARRLLERALRSSEVVRPSGLAPRHAARWVLIDHEAGPGAGTIRRIRFGIVRHPRPYPFSRQSHKVLVTYLYDVEAGRIEALEGRNLTREKGEDAD